MRGLRKQESEKFEVFFQLVQEAAAKEGAVFFLDAGEGRDIVTDDLEGEDLTGWLVPEAQAEAFEAAWQESSTPEALQAWEDLFLWAEWELQGKMVRIAFKRYE